MNSSLYRQNSLNNLSSLNGSKILSGKNQMQSFTHKQNSKPSNALNNPYRHNHLGLNPNLPVEDEYVQNLLKQIHFMNMEVKLLKEKQSQSDQNNLWGIINRANEPLVKNIIVSQEKCQNMISQLSYNREKLSHDNIKLAVDQSAILKQHQYLTEKIEKLKAERRKQDKENQDIFFNNTIKILNRLGKVKEMGRDLELQKRKMDVNRREFEMLKMEKEKNELKSNFENNRYEKDKQIEQQLLTQTNLAILTMKVLIAEHRKKIDNDDEYQDGMKYKNSKVERIGKLQAQISQANFKLLRTTESIKLAQGEREKQIKQRKQLTLQYQSLKTMHKQVEFLNLGRLQKQCQKRKRQSLDINKAEYDVKRLQSKLDETRSKMSKTEQTQIQLKFEFEGLKNEMIRLQKQKQECKQKVQKSKIELDRQGSLIKQLQRDTSRMCQQIRKLTQIQGHRKIEVCRVQNELKYDQTKRSSLNEVLKPQQAFNQVNIDDLKRVIKRNTNLNEQIVKLEAKWDELRRFL